MQFTIKLLRNIVIVGVLAVILFIWNADGLVGAVMDYGKYFGPLLLACVVVFALPLRKKPKK